MHTVILSTSLSPVSRSYMLAQEAKKRLEAKGGEVTLVDLRTLELGHFFRDAGTTKTALEPILAKADNIIFAFGIQNYTISDTLKTLLDTSMTNADYTSHLTGKFYGMLVAAGGERSYLATMTLTQICMNQWRMIQLPRIVYGVGSDFTDEGVANQQIHDRLDEFTEDFYTIGTKLLG